MALACRSIEAFAQRTLELSLQLRFPHQGQPRHQYRSRLARCPPRTVGTLVRRPPRIARPGMVAGTLHTAPPAGRQALALGSKLELAHTEQQAGVEERIALAEHIEFLEPVGLRIESQQGPDTLVGPALLELGKLVVPALGLGRQVAAALVRLGTLAAIRLIGLGQFSKQPAVGLVEPGKLVAVAEQPALEEQCTKELVAQLVSLELFVEQLLLVAAKLEQISESTFVVVKSFVFELQKLVIAAGYKLFKRLPSQLERKLFVVELLVVDVL